MEMIAASFGVELGVDGCTFVTLLEMPRVLSSFTLHLSFGFAAFACDGMSPTPDSQTFERALGESIRPKLRNQWEIGFHGAGDEAKATFRLRSEGDDQEISIGTPVGEGGVRGYEYWLSAEADME